MQLVAKLETLGHLATLRVLVLKAITFRALSSLDDPVFESCHSLQLQGQLSLPLEQVVDLSQFLDYVRCLVFGDYVVNIDHDLLLSDHTGLVELFLIRVALPLAL